MIETDQKFMKMALKLADRGIGFVEPNPAVGAIIIKGDQIVGRGWHKKFGGPHAEIDALEDCKSLGVNPKGGMMYVTLEPCCHHGKTAPCTDAIIKAGLTKVIVAMADPSSHADGKGIGQLRDAGIEVEVGMCQTQAQLLNAPFIKFTRSGQCWVILKWAQSLDGKMAWSQRSEGQRWISNEKSRTDVGNLRRRVQGILVGIETVLADDPLLTARPAREESLTRIILDRRLRIPLDSELLTTAGQTPVLIATTAQSVQNNPQLAEQIAQTGAQLLIIDTEREKLNLNVLLNELSKRNIAQLLVEGGAKVISSFLTAKLVDELCVYIAPKILGGKGAVDITAALAQLTETVGLHNVSIKVFGDNIRIAGLTEKAVKRIQSEI